jgi:hypothetical protein
MPALRGRWIAEKARSANDLASDTISLPHLINERLIKLDFRQQYHKADLLVKLSKINRRRFRLPWRRAGDAIKVSRDPSWKSP